MRTEDSEVARHFTEVVHVVTWNTVLRIDDFFCLTNFGLGHTVFLIFKLSDHMIQPILYPKTQNKKWPNFLIEMVFCYLNCSDLLWEKIVLVIEKTFWNSRLKAENLENFWDHLNNLSKQWKVRTISGSRMLFFNMFLEVSHI